MTINPFAEDKATDQAGRISDAPHTDNMSAARTEVWGVKSPAENVQNTKLAQNVPQGDGGNPVMSDAQAPGDDTKYKFHTAKQWAAAIENTMKQNTDPDPQSLKNAFNNDKTMRQWQFATDIQAAYAHGGQAEADAFIKQINDNIKGPYGPVLNIVDGKATLLFERVTSKGKWEVLDRPYEFDIVPKKFDGPNADEVAKVLQPR